MGQRVSLQEELINMKITSKQMVSASKKCEKNEKKYRKDVKKAIEKIKWQSRTRIKPLRKKKDESGD